MSKACNSQLQHRQQTNAVKQECAEVSMHILFHRSNLLFLSFFQFLPFLLLHLSSSSSPLSARTPAGRVHHIPARARASHTRTATEQLLDRLAAAGMPARACRRAPHAHTTHRSTQQQSATAGCYPRPACARPNRGYCTNILTTPTPLAALGACWLAAGGLMRGQLVASCA